MLLEEELTGFYGTDSYYKLTITPILATDGVKYFADKGKAYWAVSDMCIEAMFMKEPFLSITVTSTGKKADIIYTDGNDNILKKKHYAHTDLEQGEYKFYITDGVILLTSEY